MTVAARRTLLEVAEAEGILLIEDNPYGFFTREIAARPTLKSMDRSGTVVYIGSFAKTCFPAELRSELEISWNYPDGGFFTVLTVPFTVDQAALEISARDYGVLWTPMSGFFVDGGGQDQLRISSSYLEPEKMPEGVARLAAFIRSRTPPPAGIL
ncbi:MAG: hypothetical protein ABSA93_01835 [Streptosporangiaceae bacterium]|jgi:DNA-binding transcriptional MocR family regulator